jgi:YD repeat-containing protein
VSQASTNKFSSILQKVLLPEVILAVGLLVFNVLLLMSRPWMRPKPRPVIVTHKSAAELAKIKPTSDSYPCLVVERQSPTAPLHAEIQSCLLTLPNQAPIEQYKVFLSTGYFVMQQSDLYIPDRVPLVLTRAYRHWYSSSEAFGTGGVLSYDIHPFGDRFPYTYMMLVLPDGYQVAYHRISNGTSYVDDVQEHTGDVPTVFDRSRIAWNRDHWDMHFPDGTLYRFPEAYYSKRPAQAALVGVTNPVAGSLIFHREPGGNLIRVTSASGHWLQFSYDKSNRIFSAQDDSGRLLAYSYDELGRLSKVLTGGSLLWRYAYDPQGMSRIEDANGKVILAMHYEKDRIESLTLAGRQTYHFDYLFDRRGNVVDTRVQDPKGKFLVFKF